MMETLVQNNWNREGGISPSVVSPCAPPLMSRGGARAVDAAAEAAMLLRLLRACFRRRASAVAVPSTSTACCRCSPTLFRRCRPIDAAAAALADAPLALIALAMCSSSHLQPSCQLSDAFCCGFEPCRAAEVPTAPAASPIALLREPPSRRRSTSSLLPSLQSLSSRRSLSRKN